MAEMVPLGEEDRRRLVLKAVTRLRCVECGRLYDPQDFVLVNRWKDLWVLSTRCRHCDDPVHVIVFMHLDAEPEPVIDLTPEEMDTVADWPPICADDVLDVHTLLQECDGDLESLLAH